MARRSRIEVAELPRRSLATVLEGLEVQLDADRAGQVRAIDVARAAGEAARAADVFLIEGILKPLYEFATDHAFEGDRVRRPAPKRSRDPSARWRDELEVIRFLARCGPPTTRARIAIGGETGKCLDRASSGGSSGGAPAISAARYEPRIDDHHVRAYTCWLTLSQGERLRLVFAYAAMPGQDRGAVAMAASIREAAARDTAIAPSGITVDPKRIGPMLLIAREEGRLASVQAPAQQDEIAREIGREVTASRKAFRDRLRTQELDIKPSLLIPAASLREREREDAVITMCCVGDVVVSDGVRAPCVHADLVVDASSFARCESCGYPRKV